MPIQALRASHRVNGWEQKNTHGSLANECTNYSMATPHEDDFDADERPKASVGYRLFGQKRIALLPHSVQGRLVGRLGHQSHKVTNKPNSSCRQRMCYCTAIPVPINPIRPAIYLPVGNTWQELAGSEARSQIQSGPT